MDELSRDFNVLGNINTTILSIYCTHIPIEAPENNPEKYFNRKQSYSINLIAASEAKKKN